MRTGRTLNPTKAGRVYGKLTPSPMGVKIKDKLIHLKMNRAERRRLK
jgi:hypothetical protein